MVKKDKKCYVVNAMSSHYYDIKNTGFIKQDDVVLHKIHLFCEYKML